MNKKKEKSGKFPFGKKKKNKNKEVIATEEERASLKVKTPEEDVKQVHANHTQPTVGKVQGWINERPVDVGDVVVAPQNRLAVTATSGVSPIPSNHQTVIQQTRGNGQPPQIPVPTEPRGTGRVHSFSAKPPDQSTTETKDERKNLQQSASLVESKPKESMTYENENTGSSKKKKKGRTLLGSLTGKSSKKSRKSLTEMFEVEATKTAPDVTKDPQSPNDQESSSSEEKDDNWDDDPRNPFSSSFVFEENHTPQSPTDEKEQQNKIADFRTSPGEGRIGVPVKEEISEENETESKKKKRKLRVPSFRSGKKADPKSSPHKSTSLPTHLTELAITETESEAKVTSRLLQPPEKPPRLHTYSYESPDKPFSEENTGQFLSREERNKTKQFSSMRVSNKNPRPVLRLIPENDKLKDDKENKDDFYDDDELPPNITKKNRQGPKIFASFRKKKTPKMTDLENVTEHEAEDTRDEDDSEISNPFSDGYEPTKVPGVRCSAPPNFAAPVMGPQSVSQCEISKQRSQTLPPTHTYNLPLTRNDTDQRARTESTASETLPRREETQETQPEPKMKINLKSIKKRLSLKKTSNEAKEIRQTYALEETEEEDAVEENLLAQSPPMKVFFQGESSMEVVYTVQETEDDLEIRKRELESVFRDMESEEEEEEKPKSKNPKQILKVLNKRKKKKKSDSDEPEAFPLMEQGPPVENNGKKNKNAAEKIVEVKGQLGELKDIAHDNIKKMEEREENLEDLENRADNLDKAAIMFHKTAVEVKEKVETCCSTRTKRIVLAVVVAILVLIVIILIAVVANKSETTEVRTVHIIHVINGTAPYITPSPG